tara:strand:+ start:10 stop:519 length:510 start_codon:yes stop_codon:yes gene_type:complete
MDKYKYLKYKKKYLSLKQQFGTSNKKVAFDFDGVIHLSVYRPDKSGQVHPIEEIRNNASKLKLNIKIYNKIKQYYENGYEIYIVTHRYESERNTVNEFCEINKLNSFIKEENIFHVRGNKGDHMNKNNIFILYDDSVNVLKDVKSKYPNFELYHVYNQQGNYRKFVYLK